MSNEVVIKLFLNHQEAHTPTRNITNGVYTYKGQTLHTDGQKLWNYNTIIAEWKDSRLYINTKKYSVTTSKIQHKIKELAGVGHWEVME